MKRPAVLAAVAVASLLAGCGTGDDAGPGSDRLRVTASFYPLQWATERIGGDLVDVAALTPPGAEPHDLELTPKQVAGLSGSDVVVYLAGFQPAVDDAVAQQAPEAAFDVAPVADLTIAGADDHAEEGAGHTDDEGHDAADPHFWLDPVRFQDVARAIADRLAEADPDNAEAYRTNATALVGELADLDEEFEAGLAQCDQDQLVTAHTAFAYLADRYGFSQEGIAGISPDAEPDAAALRDLTELVREHGVTTVYTETLASPALAETVARETGAQVAVLDPVEGLSDASAGDDYLEVMRSNLETLRAGQQCR